MIIKVLLTKIGIDAHDRGAKAVIYALRDAGMEVIYTGPWQPVDSVVSAAIQENVDVIGISTLGGDYILVPSLIAQMKKRKSNIPLIIGGIIPPDIEKKLRKQGVADVFHPGTPAEDIVRRIKAVVKARKTS